MNGPPIFYRYENVADSSQMPSTVHVTNTALSAYFIKYLLQKVISVYTWELPENWNEDYFKYVLYCYGYISVFNTDKFGVICQQCGLRGYDIYYQPTHAIITNPLIRRTLEPRIGTQCEIIKLQANYTGILDIVTYYADLMSLTATALAVTTLNTRVNYVFAANDKNIAQSIKKMYDGLASGEPAVIVDKKLFNDVTNKLNMEVFGENKQSTIINELITALNAIESMFDRDIGLPVMISPKKERDLKTQVSLNTISSVSKIAMWLEELKKQVGKVNTMFGLNITVNWREEPIVNASNYQSTGAN